MHQTKLYYHDFCKYDAISKSHPCKADVLDVQLKQSNFYDIHMHPYANVNKFCLFVQETEHLQVKLTMMVCPEQAYEMFTTSETSVHSDSAFPKHELVGKTLISGCHPELGRQNLLASAICFNFYCQYWKLRFI